MEGCWPLAPSYDTGGPMARDLSGCIRMVEALVPGFAPSEIDLEDATVGIAWLDRADPLVRAGVEEAAAFFPNRTEIELPILQVVAPADVSG